MVVVGSDARCFSTDLSLLGSPSFSPAWGKLHRLTRSFPYSSFLFPIGLWILAFLALRYCRAFFFFFHFLGEKNEKKENLKFGAFVEIFFSRTWFTFLDNHDMLTWRKACSGMKSISSLFRVRILMESLRDLCSRFKSRGCVGCCAKPTPIIAVDEPSKGLKIQGRMVKKGSMSEDFWSTSTYEMENSRVQSQRSISSISTSAQNLDHHGAGSANNPSEFVNHGLLLWNQTRQQWIGNRRPEIQPQQVREPRLSWNATYDSLLGTNKPFPQPTPLSEMVDFLVDVWEQEGMYD